VSWGKPPFPLLPAVLREEWGSEQMPEWLAADLNLPIGSTFRELDEDYWQRTNGVVTQRVEFFLRQLLQSRQRRIQNLRVFPYGLPRDFSLEDIVLSVRATNSLKLGGLFWDSAALANVTFGDLFKLKNAGAATVLECACAVENAVGLSDYPPSTNRRELAIDSSPTRDADRPLSSPTTLEASLIRAALMTLRESVTNELWAHQISERDIRFNKLFPPGQGTIPARIDHLMDLPDKALSNRGNAQLGALTIAFRQIQTELARWATLTLEDAALEFLTLALAGIQQDRRWILWRVLHWAGDAEALTLEEAGAILGITRERVRQIESQVTQKIAPLRPLYFPSLDQALSVITENAPMSVSRATGLLKQIGASGLDYHPNSLIAFAEALGRTVDFEIVDVGDDELVARSGTPDELRTVIRVARRLAQASGATSLERLRESLQAHAGLAEPLDWVPKCIRACSSVVFLDEEENWFCFPTIRSTVASTVRKMLSITSPLSVDTIRDGIRKVQKFRESTRPARAVERFPLPKRVLRSLLASDGTFTVSDRDIVAFAALAVHEGTLPPSEKALVDAFEKAGRAVVNRATFFESFQEAGLSMGTAATMLTYSPIIERVGRDQWCLVGRRGELGVLFPSPTPKRADRVVDSGWSRGGELFVRFRAPDAQFSPTLIISIPAATRSYVPEGSYSAETSDGIPVGTITVAEGGRTTGYGRFLRLAGTEGTDVVEVRFATDRMAARLEVVDTDDESETVED
jgi:hypothetical protein